MKTLLTQIRRSKLNYNFKAPLYSSLYSISTVDEVQKLTIPSAWNFILSPASFECSINCSLSFSDSYFQYRNGKDHEPMKIHHIYYVENNFQIVTLEFRDANICHRIFLLQ